MCAQSHLAVSPSQLPLLTSKEMCSESWDSTHQWSAPPLQRRAAMKWKLQLHFCDESFPLQLMQHDVLLSAFHIYSNDLENCHILGKRIGQISHLPSPSASPSVISSPCAPSSGLTAHSCICFFSGQVDKGLPTWLKLSQRGSASFCTHYAAAKYRKKP